MTNGSSSWISARRASRAVPSAPPAGPAPSAPSPPQGAPGWAYGLSFLFGLAGLFFGLRILGRRRRIEREARALASRLEDHPVLPSSAERSSPRKNLRGVVSDADRLAMQSAPGEFLRAARTRFTDLAQCLGRDLKPSNVLLHPDRGPVILDFGVAWRTSAATLTRTGAVIGSVRYLAPELFEGAPVDARADVFSVGAMLYEAVTGRPLRTAESMAEFALVGDGRVVRPSRVLPVLTAEVDDIVMKASAGRAEARYATAREMARALRGSGADSGLALTERLRCDHCRGFLVTELPFCPGCGEETRWALSPGAYAVQLLEVPDVAAVIRWLSMRHGERRAGSLRWLRRRLTNPPVPLAVALSERSAEALAIGARQAGARAEVLRGRAIVGPLIRVPAATPLEIAVASALHGVTVLGIGAGALALGAPVGWVFALPAAIALAGVVVAHRYTRRPLMATGRAAPMSALHPRSSEVREALGGLRTPHARKIAAMAVSRAAVLLLGEEGAPAVSGSGRDARDVLDARDAWRFFQEALTAAAEVDAQGRVLTAGEASVSPAEGDEVALAHDLAVRRALEACQALSDALYRPPS